MRIEFPAAIEAEVPITFKDGHPIFRQKKIYLLYIRLAAIHQFT